MTVTDKDAKIVITGAAGLVGQNLIVELLNQGYSKITAIDKHAYNLGILRELHPHVESILADLATPGEWLESFHAAACIIQLHAQITGRRPELFTRNNIEATKLVLQAASQHAVPFLVHISSSVVNSVADDDYTRTKRLQEELVLLSGIPHCTLRPTLMFGWFDPKHFGWLSRFMEKSPVFPVPGNGRYMRQPLYERDFCRCIIKCIEQRPVDACFDVVGDTRIDYIDIIRAIKHAKDLKTPIIPIPYSAFYFLLKLYALFSKNPPFTADQLKALTAGDEFSGIDTQAVFGIRQTPFALAIRETFCDPVYGHIVLKR